MRWRKWPGKARIHSLLSTGTRDIEGRAVLLLCAHSPAWLHPKCNSHELLSLLLYLRGIPRFEGETWGGGGAEPGP